MAYKRSKESVFLQKASLATIEKHIKEELAKISSDETEMAKYRAKVLSMPPLSEFEKDLVKATLSRLLVDVPEPKWGFIRSLVGLKQPKNVLKDELNEFMRGELYTRYYAPTHLKCEIQKLERSLDYKRSWLSKLEEAASPKRRKKDSLIELRAAAASNVKETREVGATVRRGLTLQPWCPYCGDFLGSDPHADHIYPVSKGGRSVPKNMVYACAKCNIMKTNLTLTGFIQKFSLDRDVIEERLKQLHKEF